MPGTEKDWVRKLNKQTPLKDIYSCGIANPFVGGIPDRYYEGKKCPLWIEFKHIKKPTYQFDARKAITDRQRDWLCRCWKNGNEPHVIVGIGLTHGFILDVPEDWEITWKANIHMHLHQSIYDIALYIRKIVEGVKNCDEY